MTVSVVHATAATGTDSGGGKISKNAWNAAHTVDPTTLPGYQINRVTLTGQVVVTGTSEGGATNVLTSDSVSYDGSVIEIAFYAPRVFFSPVNSSTSYFILLLYEDSTLLGRIAQFNGPTTGGGLNLSVQTSYQRTPSAGTHTYSVKAYKASASDTADITGGNGGTGDFVAAVMRITRVA